MKMPSYSEKKGFTLIEMMIVLSLIAIISTVLVQRFSSNKTIEVENVKRIANGIVSLIDKQKLTAMSGKEVLLAGSTGTTIYPTAIRLSFQTGSIVSSYITGSYVEREGKITWGSTTTIATETGMSFPYFGDSYFKILKYGIVTTTYDVVTLTGSDTLTIDFRGPNIYFSGSNAAMGSATTLQILVGYKNTRGIIELDRRSGRIASYIDRYPGCNDADIAAGSGQVWAACNIQHGGHGCGMKNCGGDFGINNFFQWWYSDGSFVPNRISTKTLWNQWPCSLGYHIPTDQEWQATKWPWETGPDFAQRMQIPKIGQRGFDGSIWQLPDAWFWLSNEASPSNAKFVQNIYLIYNDNSSYMKSYGFAIRCIRDN